MAEPQHAIDVPFQVPQVHRLRFTHDVFRSDQQVLADLIETAGDQPARVQFWVDQAVSEAWPELAQRIHRFCDRHPQRIRRMGSLQIVPGGETIKNDIHIIERMLKVFNAADLDRRSYVIVIGGGAVLDAVGFAVAIAHRGLRLIRIPTTTLGQADSGIGVKNGINLFHKKNWLGCFAVPWAVINDAALLRTLSDRDYRCGFSESVKVALLKDGQLFETLCQSASRIAERDSAVTLPVIRRTAQLHLRHITAGGDPFEANEARPLDFGHWSAHRLEAMTEFQMRHGEAVAIGVAIDTVYSALELGLPTVAAEQTLRCLTEMGFRLDHSALDDRDALFQGMEEFRQHLGGRLTLTMLSGVGKPVDIHEVNTTSMNHAIDKVATTARV